MADKKNLSSFLIAFDGIRLNKLRGAFLMFVAKYDADLLSRLSLPSFTQLSSQMPYQDYPPSFNADFSQLKDVSLIDPTTNNIRTLKKTSSQNEAVMKKFFAFENNESPDMLLDVLELNQGNRVQEDFVNRNEYVNEFDKESYLQEESQKGSGLIIDSNSLIKGKDIEGFGDAFKTDSFNKRQEDQKDNDLSSTVMVKKKSPTRRLSVGGVGLPKEQSVFKKSPFFFEKMKEGQEKVADKGSGKRRQTYAADKKFSELAMDSVFRQKAIDELRKRQQENMMDSIINKKKIGFGHKKGFHQFKLPKRDNLMGGNMLIEEEDDESYYSEESETNKQTLKNSNKEDNDKEDNNKGDSDIGDIDLDDMEEDSFGESLRDSEIEDESNLGISDTSENEPVLNIISSKATSKLASNLRQSDKYNSLRKNKNSFDNNLLIPQNQNFKKKGKNKEGYKEVGQVMSFRVPADKQEGDRRNTLSLRSHYSKSNRSNKTNKTEGKNNEDENSSKNPNYSFTISVNGLTEVSGKATNKLRRSQQSQPINNMASTLPFPIAENNDSVYNNARNSYYSYDRSIKFSDNQSNNNYKTKSHRENVDDHNKRNSIGSFNNKRNSKINKNSKEIPFEVDSGLETGNLVDEISSSLLRRNSRNIMAVNNFDPRHLENHGNFDFKTKFRKDKGVGIEVIYENEEFREDNNEVKIMDPRFLKNGFSSKKNGNIINNQLKSGQESPFIQSMRSMKVVVTLESKFIRLENLIVSCVKKRKLLVLLILQMNNYIPTENRAIGTISILSKLVSVRMRTTFDHLYRYCVDYHKAQIIFKNFIKDYKRKRFIKDIKRLNRKKIGKGELKLFITVFRHKERNILFDAFSRLIMVSKKNISVSYNLTSIDRTNSITKSNFEGNRNFNVNRKGLLLSLQQNQSSSDIDPSNSRETNSYHKRTNSLNTGFVDMRSQRKQKKSKEETSSPKNSFKTNSQYIMNSPLNFAKGDNNLNTYNFYSKSFGIDIVSINDETGSQMDNNDQANPQTLYKVKLEIKNLSQMLKTHIKDLQKKGGDISDEAQLNLLNNISSVINLLREMENQDKTYKSHWRLDKEKIRRALKQLLAGLGMEAEKVPEKRTTPITARSDDPVLPINKKNNRPSIKKSGVEKKKAIFDQKRKITVLENMLQTLNEINWNMNTKDNRSSRRATMKSTKRTANRTTKSNRFSQDVRLKRKKNNRNKGFSSNVGMNYEVKNFLILIHTIIFKNAKKKVRTGFHKIRKRGLKINSISHFAFILLRNINKQKKIFFIRQLFFFQKSIYLKKKLLYSLKEKSEFKLKYVMYVLMVNGKCPVGFELRKHFKNTNSEVSLSDYEIRQLQEDSNKDVYPKNSEGIDYFYTNEFTNNNISFGV